MKIYEKSLNEMKKIVARYTEQTIDFEIEKTVSEIIQNVAQMVIRPFATMSTNLITSIWQIFQFPPFSLIRRWMRSMMTCGQLWNWLSKTLPAFTNKKSKTALLTSARQASCAGKRLRHWPAWGCMYQAERQPILQLF